jgi:hypothetical protein
MYAKFPFCQSFPSFLLMKDRTWQLSSFFQPAQLLPSACDVSFTPTNSATNSPSGGVNDSDALIIAEKYGGVCSTG